MITGRQAYKESVAFNAQSTKEASKLAGLQNFFSKNHKIFRNFVRQSIAGFFPELLLENYGADCNRLGAMSFRVMDVMKFGEKLKKKTQTTGPQKYYLSNTRLLEI